MITSRKRLSVVIVAVAVLAAVVALWSLKRDGSERAAPGDATPAATSTQPETQAAPAQADAGGQGEADDLGDLTEADMEDAAEDLEELVERREPTELRRPNSVAMAYFPVWKELLLEHADKAYKVWSEALRYDAVKATAREKAAASLATLPSRDTEAILRLANVQIELYWDKGGIFDSEAYEYGYHARAILQIALEEDPDSFPLLFALADTIAAMTPAHMYKELDDIAPVLEKIKAKVLSGDAPVNSDSMRAMYTWTVVNWRLGNDVADAVPVFEWLIENAEKGGWPRKKFGFGKRLERARKGKGGGTNIWFGAGPYQLPSFEPNLERVAATVTVMNGLGLPSPPKKYEKYVLPAWDYFPFEVGLLDANGDVIE